MKKETIHSDFAPKAVGPYSQAVLAGPMLYLSGQLGLHAETGKLAQGVEAQAHQAMKNIGEILKQAGLSYESIIKTTIFIKDLSDFQTVNLVYADYFTGDYPSRSCVQVAGLPLGALVEVECVALRE